MRGFKWKTQSMSAKQLWFTNLLNWATSRWRRRKRHYNSTYSRPYHMQWRWRLLDKDKCYFHTRLHQSWKQAWLQNGHQDNLLGLQHQIQQVEKDGFLSQLLLDLRGRWDLRWTPLRPLHLLPWGWQTFLWISLWSRSRLERRFQN